MATNLTCPLCYGSTGGCTGQCRWQPQTPIQERGFADIPAKGCICPPTAEKTCQRWDCGRKSVSVTARVGTISLSPTPPADKEG